MVFTGTNVVLVFSSKIFDCFDFFFFETMFFFVFFPRVFLSNNHRSLP